MKIPKIGKKYKLYDFVIKVNNMNVYDTPKNIYTTETSNRDGKTYWISENNNTWYNWQNGEIFSEIEE